LLPEAEKMKSLGYSFGRAHQLENTIMFGGARALKIPKK